MVPVLNYWVNGVKVVQNMRFPEDQCLRKHLDRYLHVIQYSWRMYLFTGGGGMIGDSLFAFYRSLGCVNHPLGVNANDKLIPDAQMSAYMSEGTYAASNGRLNASGGWVGTGKGSWLQVRIKL